MKIIKDDKAFIGSTLWLFLLLAILLIGGAFLYWLFMQISDSGGLESFLKDLGIEAGKGLFGALWGIGTGFFYDGAWKKGTDIGKKTQKYNIFANGQKIWRNYFP
jgi:hypothetical protein